MLPHFISSKHGGFDLVSFLSRGYPPVIDVDIFVQQLVYLHAMTKLIHELDDSDKKEYLSWLKENWKACERVLATMEIFTQGKEFIKAVPNEIRVAIKHVISSIKHYVFAPVTPQTLVKMSEVKLMQTEYFGVSTLRQYLHGVISILPSKFNYISLEEGIIERVRSFLFLKEDEGMIAVLFESILTKTIIKPPKRIKDPLARQIEYLVRSGAPDYFETNFSLRWGVPKHEREERKEEDRISLLPEREQLFNFFNDWQHILENFNLLADIDLLHDIIWAYYGQPHGMIKILPGDKAWLHIS